MRRVALGVLVAALAVGCADSAEDGLETDDWIFGPGGKADGPSLALQPIAAAETALIDLRGVGDSAWAGNKTPTPLAPAFGAALDRFDPMGTSYRGDISFINWESVVGTSCTTFHADSFGFLSDPANLVQAADRGFQLVGLSNNHTRDCGDTNSPQMTARSLAGVSAMRAVAWHGVAESGMRAAPPRIQKQMIKGREVRVAFASIYLGRESCPQANCRADREAVLAGLRDADADLRVLAVHVLEFNSDWEAVVTIGTDFIRDYGGDVVFGHGPHVWKPPVVVEKRDGTGHKGVVFTSLGNFIHPSLKAQSRNLIGRALFDPQTLALQQIQLVTVSTTGGDATFGATAASEVGSYGTQRIPWDDFDGASGAKAFHGAYVNVP